MLKGLGSLVARSLLLFLLSSPAWAADTLYLENADAGPPQVFTDSNGTFTIYGKSTGEVSVGFNNPSDFYNSWSFEFQAPTGSSLAPGNYDNLQRIPFQGPLQPGADFTSGDSGCDNVFGRFVVQAITTDSNNNVTSLAVDFQLYCDGTTGTPLTGAFRYNSTLPYPLAAPTADAGGNQIAIQDTDVDLDGSLSEAGGGSITAYTWTQLSGPSVSLADPSAASTVFMAPDVPAGGEDVVLQLEVDNSLGLSSTSTVTIHVANPADAETWLSVTGAQGQTTTLTPLQAPFTATPVSSGSGVQVSVNLGISESWTLDFAPPSGQTLQVGTSYEMAQTYPSQSTGYPEVAVSGNEACSGLGRFVVLDLQKDGQGNITSFAADFQITCSSFVSIGSIGGKIRYNSTAPLTAPWADAGITQLAAQGMTVTLPSTGSDAGGNGENITSYQWTQVSGPSVALSDSTAANPTFSAPDVSVGGADLVFDLTVTNSDGLTSTDTVTVHVANPADPVTAVEIESDPADPAGLGQNVFLYTPPYTVTSSGISAYAPYTGAGVRFYVNLWTLDFVVPAGQNLQTGTYPFAQAYPWQNTLSPGLAVYYAEQCVNTNGQFTILDVQTDGAGNVTAFAADFWQTCDGGKSKLRGKIRYNSSISIFDPLADAGQYQFVQQGATVALSAAASDAGGTAVTLSSYQWTQLSGPSATLSDATAEAPTFTAPNVSLGGADLVFQVTVTNSLGLTSTATVTVHVANPSDPAPFTELHMISDPGDPIGQGQTVTIDGSQEPFTISRDSGSGVGIQIGEFFQPQWNIGFAAPAGQMLQAGVTYDLAQLYPTQSPPLPGLSVAAPFQSCGLITGHFVVLDIRYDIYGNVVSLAADFDQYCAGNAAGLHGMLRYNSGVPYTTPFADAGPKQQVKQGATVTLDGSSSYAGAGSETITSYQWTQLSGPSVSLSDTAVAVPTFVAPAVSPGGADLSFQLTVTNSDGMSRSDAVTVHVYNPADPLTAMHLVSDPGDSVGQGQTIDATALTAVFNIVESTAGTVQIQVNLGNNNYWALDFAAPQGQSFQAGTAYEMAQGYYDQSPTYPGLSVGMNIGCDTISGRFVVLDVATDGAGNITSFAADFEQHCAGAVPALRGKIRFNSAYPIDDPMVDAGLPQQVIQGDTVTLSGTDSNSGGDGNTITYQWTQISGPSVSLSDPTGAVTTFSAPGVPPGGATLVFQLTITSSDGLTSTEDVTVLVANPSDPITGMYVQGKPSDSAENVQQLLMQPLNGSFALAKSGPNITITYTGTNSEIWVAEFSAPSNQTLHTGVYTGLVKAGSTPSSSPQMDVSGNSGSEYCSAITGQFNVRQISFDDAGNVTQLAVDFKQFCNGGIELAPPMLLGKIRYASTVTLREPTVYLGIDQISYQGFPVTLDGSASTGGGGSITSLSWTQLLNAGDPKVTLSDPTAAKPTFTAPSVPLGGRILSFQLTVTNSLGLSSSDVTTVTVGNQADPKTTFYYMSDPGDPVGIGGQGFATLDDADFSFNTQAQMNVYVAGYEGAGFPGAWQLYFDDATPWLPLTVGTYLVSGPPNNNAITVTSGTGPCPSPTGIFIIRDIGFNKKNQLSELGMDFVQRCSGATGQLRGSFRLNSPTPILISAPTAAAANQNITQPGRVSLDGSNSFPGWGNSVSYQWQQVGGPKVTLSNPATAIATFTANSSMLSYGGTNLAFKLTVKNSLGLSSSTNVTIRVAEPDVNLLYLQSDAGDPDRTRPDSTVCARR